MYINTFRYKPEDVDCKLCTEYRKKLGCTVKGCPFLAERIEAGVVGYGDAVQNTLAHHTALAPRLTALIRLFPGTMWQMPGISPVWRRSRPARATDATGTPLRTTPPCIC